MRTPLNSLAFFGVGTIVWPQVLTLAAYLNGVGTIDRAVTTVFGVFIAALATLPFADISSERNKD